MKKLMVAVLFAALLCGCTATDIPEATVPTTEPAVTQTAPPPTTEPPRVVVSPLAEEQYLGELGNGHDFSWEQAYPPEYVLIHFCSAVVNHRDDPYNMEYVRQTFIDADVSIHYIIDREGTVYCYVPEDRSAWHAGKGEWLGDEKYTDKMNLYSIGIELVGMGSQEDMAAYLHDWEYYKLDDSLKGFTDAQYGSLKLLVEDICQRNNIPMDRQHVIGHQEYSVRKKDPGQLFDWSRLISEE
jgi:N-acetyl-anhydromuramyl-L-alanine amidase AmpD